MLIYQRVNIKYIDFIFHTRAPAETAGLPNPSMNRSRVKATWAKEPYISHGPQVSGNLTICHGKLQI